MHVAVLAGGRSLERAVSRRSGARVELALTRLGHEVAMLDADSSLGPRLADGGFDCAFVALHGHGGEDGLVQELLELAGVPYTGAPPLACSRASDKIVAKRLLREAGLPTPVFVATGSEAVRDMGAEALLPGIAERVGLPLVVKPARGGSALGLRRVDDASQLPAALLSALAYDDRVLCERFVSGREIAVTVLRGEALPCVEAIPQGDHGYDFDARYTPGATEFVSPAADCGDAPAHAVEACRLLGCPGFARVDFLLPAAGPPQILEVNTVPGLTETSLVPLAAQAAGLTFEELVAALLEDALAAASFPAAEPGAIG
jgi:D-alanine-D-alanine ligase